MHTFPFLLCTKYKGKAQLWLFCGDDSQRGRIKRCWCCSHCKALPKHIWTIKHRNLTRIPQPLPALAFPDSRVSCSLCPTPPPLPPSYPLPTMARGRAGFLHVIHSKEPKEERRRGRGRQLPLCLPYYYDKACQLKEAAEQNDKENKIQSLPELEF